MKVNNKKTNKLELKCKELYFSKKYKNICIYDMLDKKQIDSERNRKYKQLTLLLNK